MSSRLCSIVGALLLAALVVLSGCGGGDASDEASEARPVQLVYVSWVEGIAMTHVLQAVVEDSLGREVKLTQAGGAAVAFSAVAQGDADAFVDAWLPTTHGPLWDEYGDRLTDLGPVFDSTTVGLVVPDYVDARHVRDLAAMEEALQGEVIGIESGAAINDQTRRVLADNGLDGFSVVPSGDAAMVSALERAIRRSEPVVITGWWPHWMWGRYDLRYLKGARTGDTDVFGEAEQIHKIVRPDAERLPADVRSLLASMHLSDEAMMSLMETFRPGEDDPAATARTWIRENRGVVRPWLATTDSTTAP